MKQGLARLVNLKPFFKEFLFLFISEPYKMMQNTEEDEDSPDCHHDYYTIPAGQ